jgi:hypothetical protein
MRDRHFSQDGVLFGSSHSEPSALTLPTDDDAGLLALEVQFNSLVAEIVAAQHASDVTTINPDGHSRSRVRVQVRFESATDHEDQTEKTDAVLARLTN